MLLRSITFVSLAFSGAATMAQSSFQLSYEMITPATSVAEADLVHLILKPTVSWLELNDGAKPNIIKASWSRSLMPSLADQVAESGTRYLELPLVRIYDSQGRRLKMRPDVTNPRVAASRLNEAISRMEIDEDADSLSDDIAMLKLESSARQLPEASAYVIDYSADWCHTSGPFHAALEDWHNSVQANGIVLVKATADFGRTHTAAH